MNWVNIRNEGTDFSKRKPGSPKGNPVPDYGTLFHLPLYMPKVIPNLI